MIGIGSRVRITGRECPDTYGTVAAFRRDFGIYGKMWTVKWTPEECGGLEPFVLNCYEREMIEEKPWASVHPTVDKYINTTPPELNSLEDKVIMTVKGLISNYRVTKSQVADWLTGIADKIKRS